MMQVLSHLDSAVLSSKDNIKHLLSRCTLVDGRLLLVPPLLAEAESNQDAGILHFWAALFSAMMIPSKFSATGLPYSEPLLRAFGVGPQANCPSQQRSLC